MLFLIKLERSICSTFPIPSQKIHSPPCLSLTFEKSPTRCIQSRKDPAEDATSVFRLVTWWFHVVTVASSFTDLKHRSRVYMYTYKIRWRKRRDRWYWCRLVRGLWFSSLSKQSNLSAQAWHTVPSSGIDVHTVQLDYKLLSNRQSSSTIPLWIFVLSYSCFRITETSWDRFYREWHGVK